MIKYSRLTGNVGYVWWRDGEGSTAPIPQRAGPLQHSLFVRTNLESSRPLAAALFFFIYSSRDQADAF
jgi:hypothetical protein